MKKIIVPAGMLKAVDEAISTARGIGRDLIAGHVRDIALESALRWLSENPIEPSNKQIGEMVLSAPYSNTRQAYTSTIFCIIEWQKRMFLAPEHNTDDLDKLKIQWLKNLDDMFAPAGVKEKAKEGVLEIIEACRKIPDPKNLSKPLPQNAEIKDLLYIGGRIGCENPQEASSLIEESDRRVIEAYRRGQKDKEK